MLRNPHALPVGRVPSRKAPERGKPVSKLTTRIDPSLKIALHMLAARRATSVEALVRETLVAEIEKEMDQFVVHKHYYEQMLAEQQTQARL